MEHHDQIETIVREAIRGSGSGSAHGRDSLYRVWAEVRRQLRRLSDTATSLVEDERTALQLLQRLQSATSPNRAHTQWAEESAGD